jgi:hypothetical protein
MSYQAVIRNSSDVLVDNTQIGMRISILQGSESGTEVYVETHTPTTNENGLVSIEIGAGTLVSGDFTTIDWANGLYFIKTETAVEAPLTTYTITGTSQLLSVPYALYAETTNYDNLSNLPNLFDGNYNSLTDKPTLFSGSYDDLTDKPTLFSESYDDLTDKPTLFSGSYDDLTDKPTLFSGSYNDLTDKPTGDITFACSPMNAYAKADALLNITKNTGYIEVTRSSTGVSNLSIPIDIPTSIGGVNKKIKSISIEYWNSASNSYINATYLYQYNQGAQGTLIQDFEARNILQTWTTYTIIPATPVDFSNHLEVVLFIAYGNPPSMIIIQNIWVTLTD